MGPENLERIFGRNNKSHFCKNFLQTDANFAKMLSGSCEKCSSV